MNKNYNIGRTALTQTIVEIKHELSGTDIKQAYDVLSNFTDRDLIELYGILYNEYYNKKEE